MPTQLPEDARRRLEEGQHDLRDRCWYNVQRLHKWSGRLDREGPSGEDADYYEVMGPRSLVLGPIVWDGPTDKRKLGGDEISAALRGKVRDLLERYARELATLAGGEWWSLELTGAEFGSRMAAVLQSVLADLKNVAKEADSDLGLGLEIEALVADLNTGLKAWCKDYVERYGAHIGLYGTAETGLGAQPGAPQAGASCLKDQLRVTSIDGSVRWINPEGSDPAESIWTSDDEKRISACVFDGRAAVRCELEGIFSGKEWPALVALVEPFRRYAVAVFDVYASAYSHVARTLAAYEEALNQLLLPMVLRDLFGREWDLSPGENVVRMLWQDGPDGKSEGREVSVAAGNDPDPTCVFYDLLSNAVEHRYRFCEPLPPPAPGEPPGINLKLEWWQYIRLSERHSLATAIKPYIEDRVAHWRFIYSPTALADSDSTGDTATSDVSRPEPDRVTSQASMAARASASDTIAMDSPTRIKFETGLALAEVTLDQDLKDHGPSLEIARKYVTSATLTLARCILTPNCEAPHQAIRRAYDFAELFAAETMKTAWVWLSVFSEMNASGQLEKYNREGTTEDGAPKGMTESELREWHGCLSGVAQEALDKVVPEFWKERLKYFSDIASDPPKPAEAPRIGLDTTAKEREDPVQLDLSKLLDHAQACYMDWHVSLREERDQRLNDLRRSDLSFGGRAVGAIRIYEELLVREVTKRIEIYKSVSDEYRNSEMLSTPQVDKLRERVMTSVRSSIADLEGRLQRDRAAAGDPAPLPDPQRYVTLEAVILDVVNTKLRVLETEGALRKGDIVLPTDSSADPTALFEKVEEILKPYYSQIRDQDVRLPAMQACQSDPDRTAFAAGLRGLASTWAIEALRAVLTHADVIPTASGRFDDLVNRLIMRLAEDAAEFYSTEGYDNFPTYRSQIRNALLEELPKIAQRSRDVNRRRYLGGQPSAPTATTVPDQSEVRPKANTRRTPDLQSSRERVDLVSTLASELAAIKQDLNRFCTAESLKKKHPKFVLWGHITDIEIKELVDGTAFTPKAWAENLTLRKFGLTSRETIKKDRKKLRKAQRVQPRKSSS